MGLPSFGLFYWQKFKIWESQISSPNFGTYIASTASCLLSSFNGGFQLRIWRGSQIFPAVHRAGVPPSSRDLLAHDCLSVVGLPPTPVQRYLASFPPGPLFSVPEVVPFPNMDPSAQPPPFAMAPTSPTEA